MRTETPITYDKLRELLESWENGNCTTVVAQLETQVDLLAFVHSLYLTYLKIPDFVFNLTKLQKLTYNKENP